METTETYYKVYADGELLCRCDKNHLAIDVVSGIVTHGHEWVGHAPDWSIRKVTITTTEEEV